MHLGSCWDWQMGLSREMHLGSCWDCQSAESLIGNQWADTLGRWKEKNWETCLDCQSAESLETLGRWKEKHWVMRKATCWGWQMDWQKAMPMESCWGRQRAVHLEVSEAMPKLD